MRGIKSAVEAVSGSGYNAHETAIWCNGYNSALNAVEKLTAHNPARDKICADIVKSNIICDYCIAKTGAGCHRICKKYSGFVGRKLRPC